MKAEQSRQSPQDTQTPSASFPVALAKCLGNSANLHLSLSHSAHFSSIFWFLKFQDSKVFPLSLPGIRV